MEEFGGVTRASSHIIGPRWPIILAAGIWGPSMLSEKTLHLIYRIYDFARTAAWALLCSFALYFMIFVLPHAPENLANIEGQRILEIASENRFYCEKWGMREGTESYLQCTLDLQRIRANVERRIDADLF